MGPVHLGLTIPGTTHTKSASLSATEILKAPGLPILVAVPITATTVVLPIDETQDHDNTVDPPPNETSDDKLVASILTLQERIETRLAGIPTITLSTTPREKAEEIHPRTMTTLLENRPNTS